MSEARNIKPNVVILLWGVAAGRCEFEGCNKVLYRHEVTGASDNYAEKAHIYAVNPGGARYEPDSEDHKNHFENLMLVCPQCHVTIDRNEEIYTPERLFEMKRKHEQRISTLTSIGAELHSHMVYYTAPIAGTQHSVDDGDARSALAHFGKYPTEDSPIDLSAKGMRVDEGEEDFYRGHSRNLERGVTARILPIVERGASVSLFAIAPQPLLMYLGFLLNDKYNVAVFQRHRRPSDTWRWEDEYQPVEFLTSSSQGKHAEHVALVFALSSKVAEERITGVLGKDTSIYTVTIGDPNRSFVTHPSIMDDFVRKTRQVIEEIKHHHGSEALLHVFPVMPVSLAVRFGMDFMPKTDNPLAIYDQLPDKGFVHVLGIGGGL